MSKFSILEARASPLQATMLQDTYDVAIIACVPSTVNESSTQVRDNSCQMPLSCPSFASLFCPPGHTSNSTPCLFSLSRRLSTPDTLEETVALGQSVQGVIALGSRPHESAQGVDLVLAGVAAVFVNLADAELDTGVVFGFDDAVGRAAFAGDVATEPKCQTITWNFWFRRANVSNVRRVVQGHFLTDRQSLLFRSPWLLGGLKVLLCV